MTNNVTKGYKMRPVDSSAYCVWCGGSCDYGHKERAGAGAYIMEHQGNEISRYETSDFATTEFRMLLSVMIHALEVVPEKSDVVFLSNVAYLQNYDRNTSEVIANPDLIERCIELKQRHHSVDVKIVSYHKFPLLQETHEIAHAAMLKLRNSLCAK